MNTIRMGNGSDALVTLKAVLHSHHLEYFQFYQISQKRFKLFLLKNTLLCEGYDCKGAMGRIRDKHDCSMFYDCDSNFQFPCASVSVCCFNCSIACKLKRNLFTLNATAAVVQFMTIASCIDALLFVIELTCLQPSQTIFTLLVSLKGHL